MRNGANTNKGFYIRLFEIANTGRKRKTFQNMDQILLLIEIHQRLTDNVNTEIILTENLVNRVIFTVFELIFEIFYVFE